MKRLILFLFFLIAIIVQSNGQYSKKSKELYSSKYGLKMAGGLILVRREISEIGNEENYVVNQVTLARTLPQKSFGLFGRKKFGWLYAEANALYSSYGMAFDVTSYSTGVETKKEMVEKFGYVDLQIMGGLTTNGFRIGVGPVMHVLARHDSELAVLDNFNQKLRNISYGFTGSIGYDLNRFSFDLRYDKAFRTVGDHIYYGNKKSLFLETPDALMISIAYAIID
ncbi:MAG: hypothetical protein IPO92_23640 [Saprospiraceae bacterium]|nr:hypothetical protein [Saprospiraceae bacterium]